MRIFRCGTFSLPLGKKTYIMGILNVTPDSFSDGGRYFSPRSACVHACAMVEEGCDIIDVGAVSTRPFSDTVSPTEEWERLRNVLPELRKQYDLPISVDTYNLSTAEKCLYAGVDIINDVSGVFSCEMASLIKQYGAGWVMMHGGVKINKAETYVDYPGGVLKSVNDFFASVLAKAAEEGVAAEHICLDPGFGFAKDTKQNIGLVRSFGKLENGQAALMCALSKKRFIGETGKCADVSERTAGSLAANIWCAGMGADIVRVHDIACHRQGLNVIDAALKGAE